MKEPDLSSLINNPATKDAERGLQIASGATCLTLIAAIGGVWGDVPEGVPLRLAFLDALRNFGAAFFLALMCSASRIAVWDFLARNASYLWLIAAALSVFFLFFGGVWLIADLLVATAHDLEATAHDLLPRLDKFDERLRDLEALDERLRALEPPTAEEMDR